MRKNKVLEILNEFPEELDLEKLIQKLVVMEQIQEGLDDVASGNTIAMEDVEQYFAKKHLLN